MDTTDENELECRVCRSGPDLPHRPLHSPCLCSGSIGLVHQDCLEAWLNHSNKVKCELCGLKYQFAPQYAEDTPSNIPLNTIILTMIKKALKDYIPFCCRVIAAIFVWLCFVPLLTCLLYRMWMRLESIMLSSWHLRVRENTISGIVLAAFIVLTFIVMMSFLDFLRFHGLPEGGQRQQRRQQAQAAALQIVAREQQPQQQPAAAAVIPPLQGGRPRRIINNNNNNNQDNVPLPAAVGNALPEPGEANGLLRRVRERVRIGRDQVCLRHLFIL